MTPVTPRSIREICAEPTLEPFPRGPEDIADVAALKVTPWAFVVLATLSEIIELAGAGATTEELQAHVMANVAAAEQRLQGGRLVWGQA